MIADAPRTLLLRSILPTRRQRRIAPFCCAPWRSLFAPAVLLAMLGMAERATAAITYVRGNFVTQGSPQSSVQVSFGGSQATGNLNVVIVGWEDSTSNVTSVTDSNGNAYALAIGPTRKTGLASTSIYYAKNIGAGSNTVTVTFSTSVPFPDVRIAEYSGLDTANPFDGSASGVSSSNGTSLATSSLTTTTANTVLVAGDMLQYSTSAPGANYVQRILTPHSHILEDRIVTSAGSFAATATQSQSGWWVIQMAAFKAAAGGGDTQAPTTPGSLAATPISSTQINLSWTASTDNVAVTGYRVERCQGASCSNFAEVGTPTGTTFNNTTGLSPSTTYRYRVRAHDAVPNFSGYSSIVNATTQAAPDTQAPTTPTGLGATAVSSTQINLSWTASTDNVAVTGYRVERCEGASCSNFAEVGTPSGTTFNNTGLTASTTYRYRVRAQDAVPNFSGYSSIVNATTQAPGDTQAPTAPSGLMVVASSSTEIDLAWTGSTDNVAVTAYLVERCQGAGCSNFSQVSAPGMTKFDDTGRAPATTYRYRVRAQDAVPNFSAYSNVIQIATPASGPDCD